jgi:hypothetical protein
MSESARAPRLGTPPPYADYLGGLTWPSALDWCDSFIRDARAWDDQELANGAPIVLRYLAWLAQEARGLVEQLQEGGIDFT